MDLCAILPTPAVIAFKLNIYVMAGLIVGAIVGQALDRYFGNKVLFKIIGTGVVVAGAGAGHWIANAVVSACGS